MKCHTRSAPRGLDRPAAAAEETSAPPVPAGAAGVRAGDRDRDAIGDLLGLAVAQGYLSAEEFDERSDRSLRAATLGELRAVVADLPVDALRRADPARRARQLTGARTAARAHLGAYAVGVALMLAIWSVTAVLFGATYFWPIWPILGWGVGVVSHVAPVRQALRSRRPLALPDNR